MVCDHQVSHRNSHITPFASCQCFWIPFSRQQDPFFIVNIGILHCLVAVCRVLAVPSLSFLACDSSVQMRFVVLYPYILIYVSLYPYTTIFLVVLNDSTNVLSMSEPTPQPLEKGLIHTPLPNEIVKVSLSQTADISFKKFALLALELANHWRIINVKKKGLFFFEGSHHRFIVLGFSGGCKLGSKVDWGCWSVDRPSQVA